MVDPVFVNRVALYRNTAPRHSGHTFEGKVSVHGICLDFDQVILHLSGLEYK